MYRFRYIFILLLLFVSTPLLANPFSFFKDKSFDFFPVPIFETRPDEGQSYGLMPVFLFSEKNTGSISTILAAMGQYNNIVKWSGAVMIYAYPHATTNPNEVFEFYFEYAQKFYRETWVRYFNPFFLDKLYLDTTFQWLHTPFPRFYGYGADSPQTGESNYLSQGFFFKPVFGYYITPQFRVNFTENITLTNLNTRAITDELDTLTTYAGLSGVRDSTDVIHKLGLSWDTRPNLANSKRGRFLEAGYFFSHENLGSDTSFHGFTAEALQLIPFFKEKTITALRFFFQDMYGSGIPFYHQSSLGGALELRSFIPNRFRDNGKILFTWEQRIKVLHHEFFGIPVEFHVDPFFELGRVFHQLNNLSFTDFQPIGGIGLRGLVPPNVVARVDFALGSEGYNIYTMLNYPF